MKVRTFPLLIFLLINLVGSCQSEGKQAPKIRTAPSQQELIKYNQDVLAEEERLIDNYLSRHAIPAKTGRGSLRYHVYKNGSGPKVRVGTKVTIAYEVRFLTGDVVYSSQESGNREIVLGKTNVETGLYDGLLMLRVGDRAKFVLPSHLAFGASGDGDKIPPRTTLVYDIELVSVSK